MTLSMPCNISGRNAHKFVYKMQEIKSGVGFKIRDRVVDAKSLIGLLSVQIKQGDTVTVLCYKSAESCPDYDLQAVQKIIQELAVMNDGL